MGSTFLARPLVLGLKDPPSTEVSSCQVAKTKARDSNGPLETIDDEMKCADGVPRLMSPLGMWYAFVYRRSPSEQHASPNACMKIVVYKTMGNSGEQI